jgi:glutamate carboxypeptidase
MEAAEAIREWVAGEEPRLLGLLEHIVTTESHTANPAGVAAVADAILGELEPIGFGFRQSRPPPVPAPHRWVEDVFSPGMPYTDLGSTYAGHAPGSREGLLLLLGDLDTAFPTGSLAGFPFRVEDGRAYGPGIADMKGGLVVMVAALQALDALGLDRPEVALVLSGDEQAGSLGSRSIIESAGQDADWCLCVECARRGGLLIAARGHIGVGKAIVTGREAHTGSARDSGVNALEALARLILEFNAVTNGDLGTLVTVTLASAGRRRSVVPAAAEGTIDIRTRSEDRWQETLGQLIDIAARVGEESGAAIDLRTYCHRPGIPWDDGVNDLLTLARSVGSRLGIDVQAFESAAAGSTAFRPPGVPTLDGLGPAGAGLMTEDEHVELDSIVPRAALLAGVIHGLGAG